MAEAEMAVRGSTVGISAETLGRLQSGEKLSDADRTAIIELARNAVAPFIEASEHHADDEQSEAGDVS
jgi:hypothetical protein